MTGDALKPPSRRQIVFNWIMCEDDLSKPDGWWGGTDEVENVDKLLAALDAANPAIGICTYCMTTIWSKEGMITDDHGTMHPICAVKRTYEERISEIRCSLVTAEHNVYQHKQWICRDSYILQVALASLHQALKLTEGKDT